MFEFSDKYIQALLDGIMDGSITEYELPESLYYAIANYLKKGLYKGFGSELADLHIGDKDYELLAELRENIYMFSAAKTYQEVKDLSEHLVDEDGNVRTVQEFNKIGRERFALWNDDYGTSEYNTALAQGTMAVKWNQIEADRDVLPNLTYSTTEVACPICSELDGTTLPIDDPFWDTFYPPNHYNCMCVVLQQGDDAELTTTPPDTSDEMQDVFKANVGKEKVVFNEEHPYFSTAPKDLGKNNFGLPIPEDDE